MTSISRLNGRHWWYNLVRVIAKEPHQMVAITAAASADSRESMIHDANLVTKQARAYVGGSKKRGKSHGNL